MNNLIEIHHLKKYYNHSKIKALDDITYSLSEGKVYGLIGENGAGKTTLVKILLGGIHPTSGKVSIDHHEAGSVYAKEKIGYVYEGNALPLYENPTEYLITIASLSPILNARDKIYHYLHQFGLSEFMYTKMKKFSSGMKKKVQIIASLLSDPSILILDEPTANLDPKARFEIFNFIKSMVKSKNITVILCSHNLFELEKIVDDIILIRKGKLIVTGSYQEIIETIGKKIHKFMIKTSNDHLLTPYIETLSFCKIKEYQPLTIETTELQKLKEVLSEFNYQNKIFIDEFREEKESLFTIFDYFNDVKVGEVHE